MTNLEWYQTQVDTVYHSQTHLEKVRKTKMNPSHHFLYAKN